MLVVALAACGGKAATPPQHAQLTPRQIVDTSSPAIVRIEAGENKVGTGFIVNGGGLIATNLHVIEGESKIRVKLYKDATEYPVTTIAGVDRGHDLALIWIQPKKALPVLHLGDVQPSAGDRVYAIGNPLGVFDYSITDGLVSQVRKLTDDLTILQISAAISPGSSGGPLFNQYGEVVGVTTAIITAGQNLNLAMPAKYLKPLVLQQPNAMALDKFAKVTKQEDEHEHADTDDDTSVPQREVPDHPVSVLDGCQPRDIDDTIAAIMSAIDIGAPAYNKLNKEGFEECFRIYEGTKGVRSAFGDGLLRANSLKSYKDKAWAIRDSFDGMIRVSLTWCKGNQSKCGAIKQLLPKP
jgi:hypothetical protein